MTPDNTHFSGSKVKESKGEDSIHSVDSDADAPKTTSRDLDTFFESIWALYPEKKGKAQVSEAKKKALFRIGFDEISRCIERYKRDKPDWMQYQNGKTFFSGGYVDYLDANYEPPKNEDLTEKGGINYEPLH